MKLMLLKEVCVENYANIPAAIAAGANRIELTITYPLAVHGQSWCNVWGSQVYQWTSRALVTMIRPVAISFIMIRN